jgi:alanyl-tRNA synthetase
VEVWNIVFNQYFCSSSREDLLNGKATLDKLQTPGVDTGMGYERLVTIVQQTASIYETDAFRLIFGDILDNENKKSARIVSDHLRASVFLLSDGILPSNKDRGYILRRIMRRLIVHSRKIGLSKESLLTHMSGIVEYYGDAYPELKTTSTEVAGAFFVEYDKFSKILAEALVKFSKMYEAAKADPASFPLAMAKNAFDLYQSCGLPFDITFDLLEEQDFVYDKSLLRKPVPAKNSAATD